MKVFAARSIPWNRRKRRNSRKWSKISQKLPNTSPNWKNINKLCLGKISRHKAVRIKYSVDFESSNELYGKNRKPGNANQQKAF